MAITQTISTIPQAGHRGVDARDTFVTKQEAFQDALTDTFVTEINAFKTQANTLETNVNTKEATVVAKEALMNPHYSAIDSINSNMADVNTVADNIVDIQNAEENAILAINAKNDAEDARDIAVQARNEAVDAVSSLPDGVINDNTTTLVDTWSSSKINTELGKKQDTLVSGTNIKTINGSSVLGAGDVALQPTLVSGTNIKTINSTTLLGSGDVALQPTLVSGTNIKTVNGASILGSGDVTISGGLTSFNAVDIILTSQTYTAPKTGKYRITAIGAGGSGGCSASSIYPAATGGGAGGTSIHEVDLTQGQTLTVTIGAGGTQAFQNQDGKNGGNTTVTNGSFTITANGGGGGKYKINSYSGSVLGGIGGASSGGNIANITGGNGGDITLGYSYYGCATGGGGASLREGATTRGGNITFNTSQPNYFYATGGGGCFYRGGDITSNVYAGNYATGGAGTSENGVDCSGNPAVTSGGKAANSFSSSVIGIGGNGSSGTTKPYPTLSIGAGTGGWCNNAGSQSEVADNALQLGATGGLTSSFTSSSTNNTSNNYFTGAGSGGSSSSSDTYYRATSRGGNGVVYIEYKG